MFGIDIFTLKDQRTLAFGNVFNNSFMHVLTHTKHSWPFYSTVRTITWKSSLGSSQMTSLLNVKTRVNA